MGYEIDRQKCLRCGGCVSICPVGALELTENGLVRDEKKCTKCGLCEKFCPVGAIKIKKEK